MVVLTVALAPLLGIVANPSAVPALAHPHGPRTARATASVATTGRRATATAPSWQLASVLSTIDALEQTSGPRPHSLLTGMFDEASGLCGEGVWHNSWLGVGRLLAARELRRAGDAELADEQLSAAQTLGESLYRLSFDSSRGFQRRSASGFWQSATEAEARRAIVAAGEDPAFYELSDETRCISSGAAVIFFSLLAEETAAAGAAAEAAAEAAVEAAAVRATEVGKAFTAEFFDANTCRFQRVGDATGEGAQYWRAADQAIGCLACLRLAKAGHILAHDAAATRAMAGCAVDSLLREFGYSRYATEGTPPGAYLGRVGGGVLGSSRSGCARGVRLGVLAPRNSWHDGLACFALLSSGALGVGGETPAGLVRAMTESYRCAETKQLLHRPRELRASADVSAEAASGDANSGEAPSGEADSGEEEVTFTGSQALWSAVVRAAELTSERAEAVGGADVPALRAWDAEHRKPQPSGLLPVANVYRDARLWANTEWAAWLLLDKGDFAV